MEYQIVGIDYIKGIAKTVDVLFDTMIEAVTYRNLLLKSGRYDEVEIVVRLKQEQ